MSNPIVSGVSGLLPTGLKSTGSSAVHVLATRTLSPVFSNRVRFDLAYAAGWVIGNGDMHAKNFSAFAASNGKYRLAPLYDILNTTVYEGMTDRLALPFGECCSPSPDGWDFLGYLAERFGSDLLDELYFLLFKVPTIAEQILERMTPSINDNPRRAAFLTRLADRSSKLAQTALRNINAVMD